MSKRESVPASPTTEGVSTRFDIFLSHNSRDKAVVERIAERLRRAGVEP